MARKYLTRQSNDSEIVQALHPLIQRLPRGARVLDVGCGPGVPFTRMFCDRFDVVGIDLARAQLQLARQCIPQAQLLCQDMTHPAFRDGTFDVICSFFAIFHVPRDAHQRLLLDFHRLLRRSGSLLLCLGGTDLASAEEDDFFGMPMYWSHFDADTNAALITECGFHILWSRMVTDPLCQEARHLLVFARKALAPVSITKELRKEFKNLKEEKIVGLTL